MKYFVLYVWVVIAGLLLGQSISDVAERCGHAVKVELDAVVGALAWPVLVAAAVTLDKGSVAASECEK